MSDVETKAPETNARRQMREQADQSLLDYLQELQTESSVRVTVVREAPKSWKGRNIEGTLETFDEPISEEEIRDHFGGGKYRLRIQTPNAKGSFVYAAHRTVKIAGDPKLEHLVTEDGQGVAQPNVVRETLRLSERMVDRAHKRADRAEERSTHRSDMDPSVELLVRGQQEELRELRRSLDTKDERIHQLMTKSGERGPTDTLLEKMIDGDSARIAAIRIQHEAELRTMRERHLAEVDRLFARADDQAKRQFDVQTREAANIKSAYDGRIESLKLAHQSTSEGLKREISHLERELTSAKSEVAELRSKKDKSVIDSVTELAAVKEALGSLGGEDSGGSTLDSVLSAVVGSPLLEGLGHRLVAPPQPVQMPAPPPMPRLASPDNVVELRPPPVAVSKEAAEVGAALEFMETAFSNGTPPEAFATTARNLIPPAVTAAISESGIDALLHDIAAAAPNSPLIATQRGKNWTRAVARLLVPNSETLSGS